MNQRMIPGLRSAGRAAVLALAGGVLMLTLGASPAEAHSQKWHRGGGHRHHRVVSHHHRHDARFVVPHRIVTSRAYVYRPYLHNRLYFAPHHHYHAVYRFPVYTAYGVTYEPSYYCDGVLFDPYPSGYVSYASPRFGVFIGF